MEKLQFPFYFIPFFLSRSFEFVSKNSDFFFSQLRGHKKSQLPGFILYLVAETGFHSLRH